MDDVLFDAFDPEVLAANGIEYPSSNPYNLKTRVQLWAYQMMQTNRHLTLDRMIVPPEGAIRFPEFIEKGWGWWRLLPIYWNVGSDMPLYKQYLCEYYIRNAPESIEGATASAVDRMVRRSAWTNENGRLTPLARSCFAMESKFRANCEKQELTDSEIKLSNRVKLRALEILGGGGDYVGAYAAAAALVCITKEAELMSEWVIHGQYNSSDSKCRESNQIREHALSLMFLKGSGSITAAAGAAMVGAAKEAKLLSEWLRQDPKDRIPDVTMSTDIREEACDILCDMCHEAFGSNGNNSADSNDEEEKTKSDEEDPEWKLIRCIQVVALNKNKNTENVNQKSEAESRNKLKRKMHRNSTGKARNVRTRR